MSQFYNKMAKLNANLLKPSKLGQGKIEIIQAAQATPSAGNRHLKSVLTEKRESVDHIGVADVKYEEEGTIKKADYAYQIVVPKTLIPGVGDKVAVNGVTIGAISQSVPFPAHGVTVYYKLYVTSASK